MAKRWWNTVLSRAWHGPCRVASVRPNRRLETNHRSRRAVTKPSIAWRVGARTWGRTYSRLLPFHTDWNRTPSPASDVVLPWPWRLSTLSCFQPWLRAKFASQLRDMPGLTGFRRHAVVPWAWRRWAEAASLAGAGDGVLRCI